MAKLYPDEQGKLVIELLKIATDRGTLCCCSKTMPQFHISLQNVVHSVLTDDRVFGVTADGESNYMYVSNGTSVVVKQQLSWLRRTPRSNSFSFRTCDHLILFSTEEDGVLMAIEHVFAEAFST